MQANHEFSAIYEDLVREKIKLDHPGKVHLNLEAYGFKVAEQPQAFDNRMLYDQAYFILKAIHGVMKDRTEPYTIVGHSIGCLIGMLIEAELKEKIPARLANYVCLATPLEQSPTLGINNDLAKVMSKIAQKASKPTDLYKENHQTYYLFFNGGQRDNMIAEDLSGEKLMSENEL